MLVLFSAIEKAHMQKRIIYTGKYGVDYHNCSIHKIFTKITISNKKAIIIRSVDVIVVTVFN